MTTATLKYYANMQENTEKKALRKESKKFRKVKSKRQFNREARR
jgi:hypothetical protein